ncbi:unnamed protein product [Calicophoron daubneyi]|uniref:Glycosyltransferase n=1 Tax=Calicophoron daubneyi TaxID=300641 RepID=A0AAV2TEV3_CALDB
MSKEESMKQHALVPANTLFKSHQKLVESLRNTNVTGPCNPILEEMQNSARSNTVASGVNQVCSMTTCWNWNKCLHGPHLKFCVTSRFKSQDSLFLMLSQFPHWLPSCNSDNICVKIVVTADDAIDCIHEKSDVSKPSCVAIFTEVSESVRFHKVMANQTTGSLALPIAATSFPKGKFRIGFDFLLSVLSSRITHVTQENPVQLLPPRRPILLTLSVGTINEGEAFSEPVFSYVKKIKKPEENFSANKNVSVILHLAETKQEIQECWSEAGGHEIEASQGLTWYPCDKSVRLLRYSTFGLVTRGGVEVNPLGWLTQLIACLASGAIPVVTGEGALPGGEAISQSQWSKAIFRLPEALIPQLISRIQQFTDSDIVEMRRQQSSETEQLKRFVKNERPRLTWVLAKDERTGSTWDSEHMGEPKLSRRMNEADVQNTQLVFPRYCHTLGRQPLETELNGDQRNVAKMDGSSNF